MQMIDIKNDRLKCVIVVKIKISLIVINYILQLLDLTGN